ncbi:glycosyl hydrolase [Actinocorallia populi]|uniref:glycosyl hydrolase n=1 Tax=Actinocorallia populi TaxID=2079200 RepID=UPI000D097292|nr:glycosyl hydrolase [Actinocorallia populi]
MKPIRPLIALALPAVLAAGCASGGAPQAAPEKKAPIVIDTEASGRDVYTEEVPPEPMAVQAEPAGPEAEPPASEPVTGPAGQMEDDTTSSRTARPAAPVGTSGGKVVYNMKPPKNFKRYNAPGAYNVNKLIYPRREIFGVFTDQARNQIADRRALGRKVGMQPNMIKSFYNWGNGFDPNWAQQIWAQGAIPQYELEMTDPNAATIAQVAGGEHDEFIRALAQGIRQANVPVVFSPWHEMNGDWYAWGYCGTRSKPESNACQVKNKPSDFRAAWRRMHDIFKAEGATNAIWLWQTNQVGARPQVGLKQFYPGNSYVDWLGTVGYYYGEKGWYRTFNEVFMPTIRALKKISNKPIFIPEMGMDNYNRPKDIYNFLYNVAKRSDVIGFLWFSYNKPTEIDFRIDRNAASTRAFKKYIHKAAFGFHPRTPQKMKYNARTHK